MAGNDSTEVVVGANGRAFVGPPTATPPTDITDIDTLDPDFIEVGFISEAGAKITDSKTVVNIEAWQSFYPIRRIVTGREFMVEFAMRQWNGDNVMFAFGGGTVSDTADGFSYTPPDPETIDERAMILWWQDGTKQYLLYVPRGMATANTEAVLSRAAAADLAVTFSALSDGTDPAYTLFTDDPAFASV
jgi:hypothetical protein